MLVSLVTNFEEKCNSESLEKQMHGGNLHKTINTREYIQSFQEHEALCSLPGMLASEF